MHKGLKKLLREIDPSVTIDLVDRRVNDAVQKYKNKSFSDYAEFKELLADYYEYILYRINLFDDSITLPDGFAFRYAHEILSQSYGANGTGIAYEIARTGVEGGLRQVLSDMANFIAQQETSRWLQVKVYRFWNELSPEEYDEVVDDYLEEYSHLLPSDALEGGAVRIRMHMPEILIMHPQVVRGLRNINL